MTRPQRIIAVIYYLLVVYCCIWVPWHGTAAGYVGALVVGLLDFMLSYQRQPA